MKHVLGECLLSQSQEYSLINGISISPKKNFSIIKIWLKNNSKIDIHTLLDNTIDFLILKESIYSDHSINIKKDKHKQLNYKHNRKNYKQHYKNKNKNKFYKKKYNQFRDFNKNTSQEW